MSAVGFTLVMLLSQIAMAGNVNPITYQGRILKPDGTPLTANTQFRFVIKSPNNCILWQEDKTIDLAGSSGAFTAEIGTGISAAPGSHTFQDVFDNGKTLNGVSGCDSGVPNYIPGSSDDRILFTSFNDGVNAQSVPPVAIKSVPFAQFTNLANRTRTILDKPFANVTPSIDNQVLKYNQSLDAWDIGTIAGGVSSVGLGLPSSIFNVSGSPVTSSGTLSATLATQVQNSVFAGPTSGTGTPGFRTLDATDIPNLSAGKITSGTLATAVIGVVPGANGGTVTQVATGAGLVGGPINTSGTISLGTSGVASGAYGSSSWIPTFVVDLYGRLTGAGSVAIAIDASAISSGTLSSGLIPNLAASKITTGTLAAAQLGIVPTANGGSGLDASAAGPGQILVGNGSGFTLGTLVSGTNIQILNQAGTITISSSNSGGTVTQVNTGTGLTGGGFSVNGTISLANTSVSPGVYGASAWVPTFTVDQQGRLTAAGSAAIAIDAAQVTSGTFATARFGVSGVVAGTVNSTNFIPTLSVDAYGRVTTLGSSAVSFPALQWTDVALGINYGSGGSVGIGVASPAVKLDVAGAIKIANDTATCAAGFAGAIRYSGGLLQYCDGVTPGWITLGVSGSGLQSLNGLVANNQIFAVGSSGTLAAFASGGSLHTLNIPQASTAGAVGGLLSNADYLTLTAGTIPAARVGDLDASKIVSGTLATSVLGVVPGANGGTVTQVNTGAGLVGGPFSAVGTISLGTSGVSAGSYGSAGWIPTYTVDTYGRITSTSTVEVSIDASRVTGGTFATARLGVVPAANGGSGLDGSAASNGQLLIGNGSGYSLGTITAGSNITVTNSAGGITIASSNGGGTVTQVNTGTGLSGGPISGNGTISLADTAVGMGAYGSPSQVSTFTVDQQGRLTAAGTVAINIDAAQVGSGTLATARLGNSGVTAGSYGSGNYVPTFSVDQYGRLTAAGSTAITSSQWTNVALGINYGSGGSVGIGVAAPAVKLDIDGAIKIANESASCAAGFAGAIRYTGGVLEYCNGVGPGWITLGASGSGVQSLNGLVANNQLFAVGSAGTLAAFTSAGSLHTLNIPLASTSGAVGGLLSNADYLTLTAGTIPSNRIADLDAAKITSGTFAQARLGVVSNANGGTGLNTSGAAAGQLLIGNGSGFGLGTLTAGSNITINNANGTITIASTNSGGTVTQVNTGAGLVGGPFSSVGTIALGTSGVSAGSYGSASWLPNFVVDIYGRLTSAGSTQIAIDASQITSGTLASNRGGTGLVPTAGDANRVYGVNNAGNGTEFKTIAQGTGITVNNSAGTITISTNGVGSVTQVVAGAGLTGGTITSIGTLALSTTGIGSGTVGAASFIPQIGFDAFGRITSVGSVAVSINMSSLSGTLGVAQGGTGLNGSAAANGALLVGNGSGYTLGTLTYSNGVLVSNTAGTINLATNAQTSNVINTLITRDGSGNFAAGNADLAGVGIRGSVSGVATLSAPNSFTNYSMVLPSNMGSPGQVLSTNGTSQLSWVSAPVNGGTILAASGSAAAPGIAFQADTDSGLWNPGTNTVAISTFGTTRLTVSANGDVGIGTSAPGAKLDIQGGGLRVQNGLNGQIEVGNAGLIRYENTSDRFFFGGGDDFRAVGLGGNATTANPTIFIDTVNNGSRVGIGTTSIASGNKLEVSGGAIMANNGGEVKFGELIGTGTNWISFRAPNSIAQNYSMILPGTIGTPGQVLTTDGTGALSWTTASSGVTYPLLSTTRGSVATPAYSFAGADSDNGMYLSANDQISFAVGGVQTLRLDSSGDLNVLNGGWLRVDGDILVTQNISNVATGTDGAADPGFQFIEDGDTGIFSGGASSDILGFATGGTEKMRINAGGSLGIGTSAPAARLDVNGAARSSSSILASSGTLTLLPPNSGTTSIRFPSNAGTSGQVLSTDGTGNMSWTSPSGSVSFPLLSTTLGSIGTPAYSFSGDADTGVYSPSAGILGFTGNGSEILRLNPAASSANGFSMSAGAGTFPTLTTRGAGLTGEAIGLAITARNGSGVNNFGGPVYISSGNGQTLGGSIAIRAGFGSSGAGATGGNIYIEPGYGDGTAPNTSTGGSLILMSGVAFGGGPGSASGDVVLKPALGGNIVFDGIATSLVVGENKFIGTNSVSIVSPFSLAANYSLTLPSNAGSSGQVLSTDGTGNLSWTTASGGVTFPLLSTTRGSVATPAYSFSADSNTGIYSPGAGQLAFSSAGTARIQIGNDGRIGFGGAPDASVGYRFLSNVNDEVIVVQNNSATDVSGIQFRDDGGNQRSIIGYSNSLDRTLIDLGGTQDFVFTSQFGTVEKVRITNGGSVGIGTTTPAALFDVNGTSRTASQVLAGSGTVTLLPPLAGTTSIRFPSNAGTSGQVLTTDGTGNLSWASASASVSFPLLSTTRGSVSTPAYSFSSDSDTGIYSPSANNLALTTRGTSRISVDSAGVVTVGDGTGPTRMNVSGTNAGQDVVLEVTNASNSGYATLLLNNNNGLVGEVFVNGSAQAGYGGANSMSVGTFISSPLTFLTNSAERMRINSAGSVAIGSQSNFPGLFNVERNFNGSTDFFMTNTSTGTLAQTSVAMVNNAGIAGWLYTSGSNHSNPAWRNRFILASGNLSSGGVGIETVNPSQDIRFSVGGAGLSSTESMRLNSSAQLLLGTTGATSATNKLEVYGGAIMASAKGAGAGNSGEVRVGELLANGTNWVSFRAPDALAQNYTMALPGTIGTPGQVLTSDGTGNLSWTTVSGGSPTFPLLSTTRGSIGTPAYSFSTDSDTGLFSPGPGTLAFTMNGSERVRINSNGYMGLGVTPTSPLHVVAGNGGDTVVIQDTAGWSEILFKDNGGGDRGWIGTDGTNMTMSSNAGDIRFLSNALTERMRLTNAGNLGIGTVGVSAGTRLEVSGGAITAANNGEIRFSEALANGSNYLSVRAPTALAGNGTLILPAFDGSSGQVMSTNGAGSLGFISVMANGSTVLAASGSAATPGIAFNTDSDTGLFNPGTNTLAFSTGGSERMRILADGKIGIGTSTPQNLLDLQSPSSSVVQAMNTASSSSANMGFIATNFQNGQTNAPTFFGVSYRGTSLAPAAVQNNDTLSIWGGIGANGSGYNVNTASFIQSNATQTFSPTAAGSSLTFHTTPNNSITPQTRMTIDQSGNIGVGIAPNSDSKFYISRNTTETTGFVRGLFSTFYPNPGSASNAYYYAGSSIAGKGNNANMTNAALLGHIGVAEQGGTGVIGSLKGNEGIISKYGTGNVTYASSLSAYMESSATGTTSEYAAISTAMTVSAGTITSGYGLYLSDMIAATGYGIYQVGANDQNYLQGTLAVNTTSPTALLHVGNAGVAGGTVVARFQSATGTCSLTPNTGLSCASDERLKTDINSLVAEMTLEKLLQVNSYTYVYSADDSKKVYAGFLAQQLKEYFPDLVQLNAEGFYEVAYDGLVPYITQSIKALYKMIKSNENEIQTAQRSIASVENDLKQKDQKINSLQQQVDDMKAYICGKDPDAPICSSEKK